MEKCYPFNDELKNLDNLDIQYAADIAPTQKLVIDNAEKFKNGSNEGTNEEKSRNKPFTDD